MGFFDNINPFKKKDDFGFPPLDNNNINNNQFSHNNLGIGNEQANFGDGLPHNPMGDHQGTSSFSTENTPDPRMNMPMGESLRQNRVEGMHGSSFPEYNETKTTPLQKDLELISAKLDYLKASLEAINQRLANLEHMNKSSEKRW